MASAGDGGGEFSVASHPDFAAVCSFLQVFGPSCALDAPSISDLQRLLEDTQEVASVLRELHLKLLRRAVKSVKPESWERHLIKFCHQLGLHKEAWELERFSYKKASSRVKLTLLKVLLEYQFTCHTKFKNSVNGLESSELRVEPVGRDRGGRVYWLHTDRDANLRLYREDQDEETWSLIARDREGLVKVITQLKNGEDSETVDESLLNEDSNSLSASQSAVEKTVEENEDSNEEFLSPESESDNESDSNLEKQNDKDKKLSTSTINKTKIKESPDLLESSQDDTVSSNKAKVESREPEIKPESCEPEIKPESRQPEIQPESSQPKIQPESSQPEIKPESSESEVKPETCESEIKPESLEPEIKPETREPEIQIESPNEVSDQPKEVKKTEENIDNINTADLKTEVEKPSESNIEDNVGEAIEEPVMLVRGEGNGADCESGHYGLWEEISEPVYYVWGAGCGAGCDTGNPGEAETTVDAIEENHGTDPPVDDLRAEKSKSCENIPASNNDANSSDIDSNNKKDDLENCPDKLKNENHLPLTKRVLQEATDDKASLKKQVETTPKKPCIWNVESMVKKSETSDGECSDKKITGNKISTKNKCKLEENGCNVENNATIACSSNTDESGHVINCKIINDVNEKEEIANSDKSKLNHEESDKKNIVEKRKSSLSSEDDKINKIGGDEKKNSSSNKKPFRKHKAKPINKGNAKTLCKPDLETLPPKKLRLDSSTDDCDKESSEKSTPSDRPIKFTVKESSPSKKESRITQNSITNCISDDKISNDGDDSGIEPKKSKVEKLSNDVEKEVSSKDDCENVKEPTPQRSIKKVRRGKFRRRLLKKAPEKTEDPPADSDSDKNLGELAHKRKQTSDCSVHLGDEKSTSRTPGLQPEKRKRNRNQDESVSEEEGKELVTGKRLKIKPRKIVLSSRKKVEEKVNNRKESSEDSEEVEVKPKRGKAKRSSSPRKESKEKSGKKIKKRRGADGKGKKVRSLAEESEAEDISPVRQSRRIAQLKIREEAERRQLEEVTLRELKLKHRKTKTEEGEEEWKASGVSSGSEKEERKIRRGKKWAPSDSSQPSSGSETDEPLFDRDYEEPDLEFKSDHEFSPESDLEDGSSAEPLKRARTLKEEADGFCVRCSRGDHPEWILLCDDCDEGYHASCLKPVLFLVPDGDWFCPPCQHKRLIKALEEQLVKYDVLAKVAEKEKTKRRNLEIEAEKQEQEAEREAAEASMKKSGSEDDSSSEWSSSDEGTVYRLRERRQLPVSLRAQEYDRLMSSAIKEEYKEPESSAGNQGRGKDISTIIEAAEEEKQKAEEAALQTGGGEGRRSKPRRPRRKPHKLNSLEVPSEDDNDTDEDFKEPGYEMSSESISSEADGDTRSDSRSSDELPVRRSGRDARRSRKKIVESPELKKKKGLFDETSSESSGTKDWSKKKKSSSKKRYDMTTPRKSKKKKGLKQYDAEGNVIRPRVKYGGLSGSEGSNDWSPKHRTRQKKINYTEMPNTESEDEVHKPSGKHMPDSSDEFRLDDTDSSDSGAGRRRASSGPEGEAAAGAEGEAAAAGAALDKLNTLRELVKKTAVVPLHKLPEDVTRAKTEALEAQLNARMEAAVGTATPAKTPRGRGGRGGRGSRGPRGGGSSRGGRSSATPATSTGSDPLSKLVGVKIKDISQTDGTPTPNQVEREKKKVEREARLAEKEARKLERLKKKEEREQLKEQKAREREEKKVAKAALAESRKQRRDKMEGLPVPIPVVGYPGAPARPPASVNINQQFADFQRMRQATAYRPGGGEAMAAPRLQVRPELRAMRPDLANVRAHHPPAHHPAGHHPPPSGPQHYPDRRDPTLREGTLSVAGSPQPFKPATDPPSIITRMPHMMPPHYRGPAMYMAGSPYGPPPPGARPPHMMYMHPHPLDPSPSGGGPVNMNSRHPYPGPPPGAGYYPRGYPPPRFPPPPADRPASTPPPAEPNIKSEIKTEPEPPPGSPPPSPPPAAAHPHPKIKHTESKERARTTAATRYPHGPYAPQYGPYGPYAPPGPEGYGGPMHPMQGPPRPMHSTPPPGMHRMPPQHLSGPPPQHLSGPPPQHLTRPPPPHHLASPPSHHPPPVSHHSSPHHPAPPPASHHSSAPPHHPPPPLRHAAPPAAHHPPPHHLPSPHRMPPHAGPPPHRPASPLHSTPPPSLPRRPPDALHHAQKMTAPEPVNLRPSADSVNLVAHERLRSPPPAAVQRLGPTPDAGGPPGPPAELAVPGAPVPTQLTPMEPASSKVDEAADERESPPGEAPPPGERAAERGAAAGEEGGVFGGLVSYFSSQQEDDLDG